MKKTNEQVTQEEQNKVILLRAKKGKVKDFFKRNKKKIIAGTVIVIGGIVALGKAYEMMNRDEEKEEDTFVQGLIEEDILEADI